MDEPLKVLCIHCKEHIWNWALPYPPVRGMSFRLGEKLFADGPHRVPRGVPDLLLLCPVCHSNPFPHEGWDCRRMGYIRLRIFTDQGVLPPDNQEAIAGEHTTAGPAEAP